MDINKIAKEMTREEFLDSITLDEYLDIETINGMNKDNNNIHSIKFCPDGQGLKRTATCSKFTNCKTCWEKAIENIKFKGENGMDIDITPAAKKAENMLNDLTTKKIDYDREYDILEIKEFPEETEFISEGKYISKLKDGFLKARYVDDISNSWTKCFLTKEWLNAKFKLVKKDRKVSFKEAIQAYDVYKTIKCIWLDDIYEFGESKESKLTNVDEDRLLNLILEGEWYIKED
ncbi:TPA: hypothetical protein ACXDAY_004134 [Clostridium botulinum]|uniref:hypothetical protein n=2 Tax=Clostridium botulinum TaxID=1491 RepID=UPI00035BAF03|nr:hypothetical protein [Clostridium botulinum]EPS56743.1 hypothetical protein CLQ_01641 [Clostridium botulinum Af84]MBN3351672.1 hypothetical protein [Clostridium botulinum]MBN3360510.1 hypothetical protein [Clostridium botulinum]NFM83724.1 hypothetical protein [Clostridium botulinum]NFP12706.1 hypothetical protein [Clostridium botulinum]